MLCELMLLTGLNSYVRCLSHLINFCTLTFNTVKVPAGVWLIERPHGCAIDTTSLPCVLGGRRRTFDLINLLLRNLQECISVEELRQLVLFVIGSHLSR